MLLFVGVVAVVVAGLSAFGIRPLGGTWDEPTSEIRSVEIVDRGCYDEVRQYSRSKQVNDSATYAGVINDTSSDTELSAEVRRTSPERADVTTYRLDIRTHEPQSLDDSCPGAIVYRVEYDAPYDPMTSGLRHMRFVDGDLRGCGGSSSGSDLGCVELMDETETHWTNRSATGS